MKLLKKALRNIIVILLIIFVILSTLTPKNVKARSNMQSVDPGGSGNNMTVAQGRANIANFAVNFCNEHSADCVYNGNWSLSTIQTRRGQTYRSDDIAGKVYEFDCAGWVSFAINRALEIDYPQANSGSGGFILPKGIQDTTHFQEVSLSQIEPGDILYDPDAPHVAIYIGNNQVVDMWVTIENGVTKSSGGLKIRTINSSYTMTSWGACTFSGAARLVSIDGAHFDPIEGGATLPEGGSESGNWDTEEVDLDEIADKFTFDGMPPTIIHQDEKIDIFRWIFDGISGFMDYITGAIITLILKGPILGYTSYIERFVNNFLHGLN